MVHLGSWSKELKYLGFLVFVFALIGGYLLDKTAIDAEWSNQAHAQQGGGVFQGGQKFVTLTTVSTNCGTLGIPGPHQVYEISLQSTATTNMFLHLYDIASTPVAGALPGQIGVYVLPGTAAPPAGGFAPTISVGAASVSSGIGFCITGALPLADATNGVVGGVVNWTVK